MEFIDLRSDTVTQPTPAMRQAMAEALVGDDVYGEDPTINRLQQMAADKMGKEAGLYVVSGTMGNLVAILATCGRGDEAIMGNKAHSFLYEVGGLSALGGVTPYTVPNQPDGTLKLADIEAAIRDTTNVHFPTSKMVILENTHNRCGGQPLTPEYTRQVAELAHSHQLSLHIDGARIFNAAAALGVNVKELAAPADSITFCLSKGLCAPVGSVLCGSQEFIAEARKVRKQLGGGMRQAGILAAAGIVALETMTERLGEDHARARRLAEGLAAVPGVSLTFGIPATNMVFIDLDERLGMTAAELCQQLAACGIRVNPSGVRHMRLVVHAQIDDRAIEQTIGAVHHILKG